MDNGSAIWKKDILRDRKTLTEMMAEAPVDWILVQDEKEVKVLLDKVGILRNTGFFRKEKMLDSYIRKKQRKNNYDLKKRHFSSITGMKKAYRMEAMA